MKNVTRTIRALFPVLLSAALFSSCVKEVAVDGPDTRDEEQLVRFTLKVPSSSMPASRALSSTHEDEVGDLHVLLFNSSDKLVKHEVAEETATAGIYDVKLPEGTYEVMIIGNIGNVTSTRYMAGTAKSTILSALTVAKATENTATGDRSDKWDVNTDGGNTGYLIPMWGYFASATISESSNNLGTVYLFRMVSKIDVKIPRENSLGTDVLSAGDFEVEAVTFHNYNTSGTVVPTLTNGSWTEINGAATAPSVPATGNFFVTGYDKYQRYTGFVDNVTVDADTKPALNIGGKNTELSGYVYAFEADKGSVYADRPCIVIQGKYKGGESSYYRVDLIASGTSNYLHLLRNHRYTIYLEKVTGHGYGSIEEAYKSVPMNFTAEVVVWNEGNLGTIAFDGQNYLAVSQTEFELGREAVATKTSENTLVISTDVTTGWSSTISATATPDSSNPAPDWIELIPPLTITNSKDEAYLQISENDTGEERTAYVLISAGRLTVAIKVTQLTKMDVRISIYELDDQNNRIGEISILEFATASTSSAQAEARKFEVSWIPKEADLQINTILTGDSFVYASGSDLISEVTVSDGSGSAVWNIIPGDLNANAAEPFFERSVMAVFNVVYEGEQVAQTLQLRHFNYNAAVETDNVYLLDGKAKSFTVKSNADWKAYFIKQVPGVGIEKDFITRMGSVASLPAYNVESKTLIGQGSYNIPQGSQIYFNVINEMVGVPELYSGNGYILVESADNDPSKFNPISKELFCCTALIRGESNSYIVDNRNNKHLFPLMIPTSQLVAAKSAFSGAMGTLVADINNDMNNLTAEIIWSDRAADWEDTTHKGEADAVVRSVTFLKGASMSDSYILVMPGSSVGNCGIALKHNDDIKWSWHIWNVAYYPYSSDYLEESAVTSVNWLDRNLGALGNSAADGLTAKGLLYQWGRKDPFSGTGGIFYPVDLVIESGPIQLRTSLANPQTFYTTTPFGTDVGNWETTNVHMWRQSDAVFDPCPAGYRVRRNDFPETGGVVAADNQGITWSSSGGWYPITGNREFNTGLHTVTTEYNRYAEMGQYWRTYPTSTTQYTTGYIFGFHPYGTQTTMVNNSPCRKSYGAAVRCVSADNI